MKFISKKIIAPMLLQLLCVLALAGCVDGNDHAVNSDNVLNRLHNFYNIDTQLLHNFEIVCDLKGDTFTGRAPHYCVMILHAEPTAFLDSFSENDLDGFSSEKNPDIKDMIDAHTCLRIPDAHYPDWDNDYSWAVTGESDKVYILYFPNDFKLIFYETGH